MDIVEHPARIKVVAMGRRWGKTVMSGTISVAAGMRGFQRVAWVAPTYKQSRPLWQWAVYANNGVGTVSESERTIRYGKSGFFGVYSADNADTLRGESFNLVVIDEAARCKYQVWTDVIMPTLADLNGECILISTPDGKNWFYHEYLRGMSGEEGYASFTAPSTNNPLPAIQEAAERARKVVSDRTYQQEWLAKFVDDGGVVFSHVRECATAMKRDTPEQNKTYVGGLDWALSSDYTVLSIFDAVTDELVYQDRFNGIDYRLQRERIAATCRRFNVETVIAEENAMGKPNNDELRRMGIMVRDFTTTSATKATIIEDLKSAFDNRRIKILNDHIIINELEAFEQERMASGNVRYGAPGGLHDDTVMSIALGWSACAKRIDTKLYGW